MLRWAWGGVGMLTFVWSWTRHWCYAEHGVGWGCERENALCPDLLKKTAQVYMHNDHWNWQGKKRSGFRVEGLPNARKIIFLKYFYFETATKHWKGCHFLTMVMRLHARFRIRRDVYVPSAKQTWQLDPSKMEALVKIISIDDYQLPISSPLKIHHTSIGLH